MGIFDFVVSAGKKLGILDSEKEQKPAGVAPDAKIEANKSMAAALLENVQRNNLDVKDLEVKFDGGTATVWGKASTQAEREKVILLVGNTAAVARVDDQMSTEKQEPEARFYTVKRGDTLSRIAKEVYGDAGKYPVIFEANRPMLSDPDKIYPDQVLRIPALEKQ